MKGIGSWLTKRGDISKNKLALVYQERRFTYSEFNLRVNRLANGLWELGIRKGDRVAALLLNGNEFLEAFYACAKLGAVYVPINFRLGASEVEYIMNDTGAQIFIYSAQLLNVAKEVISHTRLSHGIQVGGQPEDAVLGYESVLDANSDKEPVFDVEWEDLFLIMYTSGTTSRPKGVMLTHFSFRSTLLDVLNCAPFRSSDTGLTVAPLFHAGAMMNWTMPILYQGGTVVIEDKFEPVSLLQTIEKWKITSLFLVPAMWVTIKNTPEIDKYDISSLHFCITGGATTPAPVIEFYQKRGISLMEGYGMTEADGIYVILDQESRILKNGSVGKPFMHVEVKIVDVNDREVPPNTPGELIARGPNIMKGYWNKPEATREVLKGGWLYTGDICRIDEEGYIYFIDRKKDMIISGGENIASAEVEYVLSRHPNIREVAVIGVPDEKWGETVLAVAALDDPNQSVTIEDLQQFCEGKLARFKFPRLLEVVPELPRNPSGKLLKASLRKLYTAKYESNKPSSDLPMEKSS